MDTRAPRLPYPYAWWVDEALGSELPREHRATCSDCIMLKAEGHHPDPEHGQPFNPATKCCTYYPYLPNYSIGLLLTSGAGELEVGTAAVRHNIRQRIGCTPLGIDGPPGLQLSYERSRDDIFGVDARFMCPYLITGANPHCGIHPYRDHVCATYFCKHDRSMLDLDFWLSVRAMFRTAKKALATRCVLELCPDSEVLDLLFLSDGMPSKVRGRQLSAWIDSDGHLSADTSRRLWGRWYGKEEEFFALCGDRVKALGWKEVRALAGPGLAVLEHRARKALARLQHPDIPPRLKWVGSGPQFVIDRDRFTQGTTIVTPLHRHDFVAIPTRAFDVLEGFDGSESTDAVIDRLRTSRGVELDRSLIRQMVDLGVLEEVEDGEPLEPPFTPDRLTPQARLRFSRVAHLASQIGFDEGGRATVTLQLGFKEIEFDEPDLLEFGRQLAIHKNGFLAEEATHWALGGATLSWEKVSELLEALCSEGILKVV
ncbi:MAG: hypothetical protein JW797_13385 [Bradymonadales bacterium]|nr:hypothetical protein [Bradymonadales bacterium]